MGVEERLARIEGILEQMDRRLNHVETGLRELRGELNVRIEGLNIRIDGLFKWMVGLIAGVWGTVIAFMLPILLKLLGAI